MAAPGGAQSAMAAATSNALPGGTADMVPPIHKGDVLPREAIPRGHEGDVVTPQDAAQVQAAENAAFGQTAKGGPASRMQSAAAKNIQAGGVGPTGGTGGVAMPAAAGTTGGAMAPGGMMRQVGQAGMGMGGAGATGGGMGAGQQCQMGGTTSASDVPPPRSIP